MIEKTARKRKSRKTDDCYDHFRLRGEYDMKCNLCQTSLCYNCRYKRYTYYNAKYKVYCEFCWYKIQILES